MKRADILKLVFIIGVGLMMIANGQTKQENKHGQSGIYTSYHGLIMCGYQGWFSAPGDGTGDTWGHYGRNGKFDDDHCTIDLWPDVSEYKKTYETSFKHADGSPVHVFSSNDESTVDLHFKWMKEYGIDGVFMQRFFGRTKTAKRRKETSQILEYGAEASEKYGRAFAVMYDLSGLNPGESISSVIEDWKYLVDSRKVTNRETYLYHNNKPLVTIWGIGFPDRPYTVRDVDIMRLIDFLKNDPEYGQCSVMLGVPTYWRTLNKDCNNDPYIHEVIKKADMIMPWMVQRFSPYIHHEMDRYRDIILADMEWCDKNNIEYIPCVHPGFSWYNISHSSDRHKP